MNFDRPENSGPPEFYYDDKQASKYTSNSHIIEVQTKLSERAYELLCLDENQSCLLLDIGCGSGLSGDVLSEHGHQWVGMDISKSMLNVANDMEVEGDLIEADIGDGFNFRVGAFDGAISVSAVQWLCVSHYKHHIPQKRLMKFFTSLYKCLKQGSRAILQVYTETPNQMEMITNCAMKVGFTGSLVIDYPNSTRAKKMFLCLFAGNPPKGAILPKAKNGDEDSDDVNVDDNDDDEDDKRKNAKFESSRERVNHVNNKRQSKALSRKQWIIKKKESLQAKGIEVRPNSKYTGRKRKIYW